jgi:tetratricopeptide (TPR) repeat protein
MATSFVGLARVFLLKGEIETAQEAVAAGLAKAEETGAEDILTEIYQTQAEILLARSEWDEAKAAAERATSLAVKGGNRSLEAAGWRVASEIELRQGNPAAAREVIAKAQQTLADVTDELERARVAAQTGRINMAEGQYTQADTDLRVAKEIFMRLGASIDLKRVEDALRQPSIPSDIV